MSGHQHTHQQDDKQLIAKVACFIVIFMLIEALSGLWFNSLALLADAGHMANDAFSLLLAWLALHLAGTYQKWAKILTVVNGLTLVLVAVWIMAEAYGRWHNPEPINSLPMTAVAFVGLIVNLIAGKMMNHADHDNLNVRAAYLHILADLAGSAVAIVAGLSAYFWGILWIDSLASGLLGLMILWAGIRLTAQAASKNHSANTH